MFEENHSHPDNDKHIKLTLCRSVLHNTSANGFLPPTNETIELFSAEEQSDSLLNSASVVDA